MEYKILRQITALKDALAEELQRKYKEMPNGKSLSLSKFNELFRNPFFYGYFKWKDGIYKGRHGAMISKELFYQAQARFNGRSSTCAKVCSQKPIREDKLEEQIKAICVQLISLPLPINGPLNNSKQTAGRGDQLCEQAHRDLVGSC